MITAARGPFVPQVVPAQATIREHNDFTHYRPKIYSSQLAIDVLIENGQGTKPHVGFLI